MSDVTSLLTDALVLSGIGLGAYGTRNFWQPALFRRMHPSLNGSNGSPRISRRSQLAAMEQRQFELEDIRHEQLMAAEEAKLVVEKAKAEMVRRQVAAELERETQKFIALTGNTVTDDNSIPDAPSSLLFDSSISESLKYKPARQRSR